MLNGLLGDKRIDSFFSSGSGISLGFERISFSPPLPINYCAVGENPFCWKYNEKNIRSLFAHAFMKSRLTVFLQLIFRRHIYKKNFDFTANVPEEEITSPLLKSLDLSIFIDNWIKNNCFPFRIPDQMFTVKNAMRSY